MSKQFLGKLMAGAGVGAWASWKFFGLDLPRVPGFLVLGVLCWGGLYLAYVDEDEADASSEGGEGSPAREDSGGSSVAASAGEASGVESGDEVAGG